MSSTILLDPYICDFVLLPIFVVVICSNIIRSNLSTIVGQQQPMPMKPTDLDVKRNVLFARVAALKKYGGVLPHDDFGKKKALYLKEKIGLLHQVPPQPDAMDMMQQNQDPTAAFGMMKGQIVFIALHGFLGYWVSHLFSGFLVAKTPFPLTHKIKAMLQRGVEVPGLDTSYVSSLSWYFFVMIASSGLIQLFQSFWGGEAETDPTADMQMMMGGMMPGGAQANPMAMAMGGPDFKKLFEGERQGLDLTPYEDALGKVEQKALEKLRNSE